MRYQKKKKKFLPHPERKICMKVEIQIIIKISKLFISQSVVERIICLNIERVPLYENGDIGCLEIRVCPNYGKLTFSGGAGKKS